MKITAITPHLAYSKGNHGISYVSDNKPSTFGIAIACLFGGPRQLPKAMPNGVIFVLKAVVSHIHTILRRVAT